MTEEKLSNDLRILIILVAIFGTILFPICCMLFANNVISTFENPKLISIQSDSYTNINDNAFAMFPGMFQALAIFFSGFFALFGWIMIFTEYGLDKKYARYLNIIPIVGGIVCFIGLNMPSSGTGFITTNSILFSTGGAVLLMGVAGRMGFFNKPGVVKS